MSVYHKMTQRRDPDRDVIDGTAENIASIMGGGGLKGVDHGYGWVVDGTSCPPRRYSD